MGKYVKNKLIEENFYRIIQFMFYEILSEKSFLFRKNDQFRENSNFKRFS